MILLSPEVGERETLEKLLSPLGGEDSGEGGGVGADAKYEPFRRQDRSDR